MWELWYLEECSLLREPECVHYLNCSEQKPWRIYRGKACEDSQICVPILARCWWKGVYETFQKRVVTYSPWVSAVTGSPELAAMANCLRAVWSLSCRAGRAKRSWKLLNSDEIQVCFQSAEMSQVRKETQELPGRGHKGLLPSWESLLALLGVCGLLLFNLLLAADVCGRASHCQHSSKK